MGTDGLIVEALQAVDPHRGGSPSMGPNWTCARTWDEKSDGSPMVAVRWSVLSTALLTTDDLDEIGHTSFDADQPLGVATELVDAVERGLLADKLIRDMR
jgi:hypothetical protein